MISSHSIPDAVSSQNTNNEIFTVGLISNSTNDPDDLCNAYPDHNDFQLLSIGFLHQALVLNHVQQYSSLRGFMTLHHAKDHFTPDQYEKYFPGETYHTKSRPVRGGIFYCSPRRMNVVVFRLRIYGATRPTVLFSAIEHPTFPITIHYYLYSLCAVSPLINLETQHDGRSARVG